MDVTPIDGLFVITLRQVAEARGVVREFYRSSTAALSPARFVHSWKQINCTETRYGAVRGLHAEAMTKLVGVVAGRAFGAYVDLREGSETRGHVTTVDLAPGREVLVPEGVANGFQCLSPQGCQYLYCFDREWQPQMAGQALCPLDPDLAIAWPVPIDPHNPGQISAKDAAAPSLASLLGPSS